ncbi:hypothetical protein, partial [Yersinia pestis]
SSLRVSEPVYAEAINITSTDRKVIYQRNNTGNLKDGRYMPSSKQPNNNTLSAACTQAIN